MNNATLDSVTLDSIPSSGSITPAFSDVGCSITTSDYKWLTSTLKTAQQQSALRPYYTCQIIDDTLAPNQIISSPGQPLQGSVVMAPNGNLLAVGLDTSNNVGFWKISDGSNSSLWSSAPTVILENNSANRNANNHYAIQVSDYIAGQYVIDIYFFGNWSGTLSVIHYQSTNSGATFTSSVSFSSTASLTSSTNSSIAAGKPYQDNSGAIVSTVFYIDGGSSNIYNIRYQQYSSLTGLNSVVSWTAKDVNTGDWNLNSIDVSYIKGYWYVFFSGYHQYYEQTNQNSSVLNYSLYFTKILNFQNSSTLDFWSAPTEIISALSSSPQNLNSFTLPQATYNSQTGVLYVTFKGKVVTSITNTNGSTNIETTINYYQCLSVDLKNFTYPQPLIFNDGTEFTDTYPYSFAFQNNFAYLAGNGQLWQYIQNNIVADVSSDITQYQTTETAENPLTLALTIGNANNKWYAGTPPTENGYKAIAQNKKINLFQGYYNLAGIPEVAPKNIFYIDDITQNVTSTDNDLAFASRDLYKLLSITTTKFTYDFTGIEKSVDIFDGTTSQNYNNVIGTFSESGNELVSTTDSYYKSLGVWTNYQQSRANMIMTVCAQLPSPSTSGNEVHIYFFYISSTYSSGSLSYTGLRLRVATNGSGTTYNYYIENCGSAIRSGTFPVGTTNFFPFLFVKNGYDTFQVYVGSDSSNGLGIQAFNTGQALGAEFTVSVNAPNDLGSVAFGSNLSTSLGGTTYFANFRYIEFDSSLNMEELIKSISTKAGVLNYKMPTLFQDYLYNDTHYNGNYSLTNRIMVIPGSSLVMKTDMEFSNAEIKFEAQMNVLSVGSSEYFDFVFRSSSNTSINDCYFLRFQYNPTNSIVSVQLFTNSGSSYLMGGTSLYGQTSNNIRFDLTQWHKYRVVFFDSYIFVMIEDEIVFGWYENNNTIAPYSNGYIGFRTQSGASVDVKNIVGTTLWTQIETFSVNPGDDLESSVEAVIGTLRVYYFSDNWGRMKVVQLSSSDPSTYTYQNQLIVQNVDTSSKETINQVTVIGLNNITATARDGVSIAQGGIIREEIINDNTVTTYAAALSRAQNELSNADKFLNQYSPQQALNVGSEIYDVVTVINTGANTSNINEIVRNYSQNINSGGNNFSYGIQLDVGNV